MNNSMILDSAKDFFTEKFREYGNGPEVADWNSSEAQEVRFEQICKILPSDEVFFTICDFGCGLGDLKEYLGKRYKNFRYTGVDINELIVERAILTHGDCFEVGTSVSGEYDYIVSSGVFNKSQCCDEDIWENYILETIDMFNSQAIKGFSFNCLTSYSDKDHRKSDLYYADPCFIFDYCKKNFSRNVALLHDYELYDFTILVRKEGRSKR